MRGPCVALFELAVEIEEVVEEGVGPVGMAVATGSGDVIVGDFLDHQSLVQAVVDAGEKVVDTAVEDDVDITGFQTVDIVDYRRLGPALRVLVVVAEIILYVPALGEGQDVDTARHAAGIAEYIRMAEGQIKGTVATHAETGYGPVAGVGYGRIVAVDIFYQFIGNESLHLHFVIDGGVEIPTVVAVGQHEYHAVLVGQFRQTGLGFEPLPGGSAVAVEQIYYRQTLVGTDGIGNHDIYLFGGFKQESPHAQGVDAGGSGQQEGAEHEEEESEAFHWR